MRIIEATDTRRLRRLLSHDASRDPRVERAVARIVADVRRRGDAAVRDWEERVSGGSAPSVHSVRSVFSAPSASSVRSASSAPSASSVLSAITVAARHIRAVAQRQVPRPFTVVVRPGVRIEQHVQPLERVGCYVPGGRHPLPSTLLMTAIPARVAGVRDVIVCCPNPAPAVIAAARAAGVDRLLPIGGAQAIAAMAYGTETIPRVDKIVGPGGVWVTAAKALVSRDCAIDMHAGPSEIVVYSNRGRADWIAADLIAQAEHDPAARAILVTTRRRLASAVQREVQRQLREVPAAAAAIARHGGIVLATSRARALDVVNHLAPEHLVCDAGEDVAEFRAAGTIFVGDWSAQASGDYCTGSNHVLPTGRAARVRGGLSAADFVRVFTVQRLTAGGLRAIGPVAATLADVEGLAGHAASIRMRLTS